MNPLYDFEDIDDYVQGRMSDSDRAAFETAMTADPKLAAQVEALRAETFILRTLRREGLLEKLTEWKGEMPAQRKAVLLWHRRWPLAAAAAAVIALLIWGLWQYGGLRPKPAETIADNPAAPTDSVIAPTVALEPTDSLTKIAKEKSLPAPPQINSPTSDFIALAMKFYEPQHVYGTLMGEPGQADTSRFDKAVALFNKKDYKRALVLLEDPDTRQLQDYLFLRAHTYYQLKRFPEAAADFRKLQEVRMPRFRYNAQWGEAMATLAQMPRSRESLQVLLRPMLENETHPYHQKAVDLNKNLK